MRSSFLTKRTLVHQGHPWKVKSGTTSLVVEVDFVVAALSLGDPVILDPVIGFSIKSDFRSSSSYMMNALHNPTLHHEAGAYREFQGPPAYKNRRDLFSELPASHCAGFSIPFHRRRPRASRGELVAGRQSLPKSPALVRIRWSKKELRLLSIRNVQKCIHMKATTRKGLTPFLPFRGSRAGLFSPLLYGGVLPPPHSPHAGLRFPL